MKFTTVYKNVQSLIEFNVIPVDNIAFTLKIHKDNLSNLNYYTQDNITAENLTTLAGFYGLEYSDMLINHENGFKHKLRESYYTKIRTKLPENLIQVPTKKSFMDKILSLIGIK